MSNDAEWGPWVEHDGRGVPHAVRGKLVRAEFESSPGCFSIGEGIAGSGSGLSWDWSLWSTVDPTDGFLIPRIIRYRVRKPKGLTILEQIVASPPQEPIGKPVPDLVPA